MNPSNQLGIYGQKQPVKPQDAPLNPEKSLLQSSQQAKSPSLRPSTGAGEGQGKGKFRVLTGFWGGGGSPTCSVAGGGCHSSGSRLGSFGSMEAHPSLDFFAKKPKSCCFWGRTRLRVAPQHPPPRGVCRGSSLSFAPPVPTHAWSSCSEAEVPGCSPGTGVTCLPKEGLAGGGTGGGRRRSVMQAGVGYCSWEPVRPQLRF